MGCPLRHHPRNHSWWRGWWELSVWQHSLNYFCPYSFFSLLPLCLCLPDERQLILQKSARMVLLAVQKSLISKRQMISALSRGQNYSDLESSKSEASRVCQKWWIAKLAFPQNSFAGSSSVDNQSGHIYCSPGLDLGFFFSCTTKEENRPLQKRTEHLQWPWKHFPMIVPVESYPEWCSYS